MNDEYLDIKLKKKQQDKVIESSFPFMIKTDRLTSLLYNLSSIRTLITDSACFSTILYFKTYKFGKPAVQAFCTYFATAEEAKKAATIWIVVHAPYTITLVFDNNIQKGVYDLLDKCA